MATFFKNKIVKEVGITPEVVVEIPAGVRATVIGMNLANLTSSPVFASVLVEDATSIQGFLIKDVMIPPQSSLRPVSSGEKLILAEDNKLLLQCNVEQGFDAVISYVEVV